MSQRAVNGLGRSSLISLGGISPIVLGRPRSIELETSLIAGVDAVDLAIQSSQDQLDISSHIATSMAENPPTRRHPNPIRPAYAKRGGSIHPFSYRCNRIQDLFNLGI